MKAILLATALALALPVGTAFAEGAIANNTTTSMGAPIQSPNYSAPRSAVVPGLPTQARVAQQMNGGHERQLQAKVGEVNSAVRGAPPVV